jgi:leucine-rich repeat protein SHOC2
MKYISTLIMTVIFGTVGYSQEGHIYESIKEAILAKDSAYMLSLSDDLSNQDLTSLGELTNLHALWINSSELTEIPESISKLSNLSVLDLSNNQLGSVPTWIGGLKGLEKLDLSGNQLKRLPNSIVELTNLRVLYLHHNTIDSLPPEIGKLVQLVGLDLRDNTINPQEVSRIKRLLPRLNYFGSN